MSNEPAKSFGFSIRLRGLLKIAGFAACLTTMLGFLGQFFWILDLFSHFRVQYLIGLVILSILLLALRQHRTAILFMLFACVNLVLLLPFYFGAHNPAPAGMPTMRAMLLNVNTRLGDPVKVKQLILDTDPDIIALEEISSRWITDLAWISNSYPYSIAQPREDNFGIALFSKFPLADEKIVYIGNAEVPSILATVINEKTSLRVIATHPLPPIGREYFDWRNDQLDHLPDYVSASMPQILLGDLNATPWSYHFVRLLSRSGLKNSSIGRGIQPSWPNNNPLLRIPIDHFLHSADIEIVDRRTGADVSSDHYPVIVDFVIMNRGK
ncbi:MAG: endonuclease/exonuclease/phosphatase family protein [Candidatus Riflebacteria bacterium]|nr:endonuclease/exonuclease/phosphatase family protein [Candidatus Riflebacteria bacterium]